MAYISKNVKKTEAPFYDDIEVLYVASKLGYYDVVEFFLSKIPNKTLSNTMSLSRKTPLWAASYGGYKNIVELLLGI
jgi:ankyrin repeat protein